jgi:hypothetical protein
MKYYLLFLTAVVLAAINYGEAATNLNTYTLTVHSPEVGECRIIDSNEGHTIEMDDYGYLMAPGKPMLPSRNFRIALPPGARALSAEVKSTGQSQLPGTYRIRPTPPMIPIPEPGNSRDDYEKIRSEWQENREHVYSSDEAYPAERGKMTASGTLRKYSYASVSFYPFSYHPLSGRLIHHSYAEIIINYEMPVTGSAEHKRVEENKLDTSADEQASDLFSNYSEMEEEYLTGHPVSDPRVFHKRDTNGYLIITAPSLLDAIFSSGFTNWKTSLGYDVRTILTDDDRIMGQPGSDLAEQIRSFLRANYIPWGIRYLLLVGDYETVPMRYCYPDPNYHGSGGEVPTDHYYADLSYPDEDSWDLDRDGYYGEFGHDSPDFLAEVAVGRIPTSDINRITYTLDKLFAFEQDTGDWKNNALHAGAIIAFENQDHDYDLPHVDGCRSLFYIERDFMSSWEISHYGEAEGLEPSEFSWPALNRDAFQNDWRNNYYGLVNWSAHGSGTGAYRMIWYTDDGDGIPETDGSDRIESPDFISCWSNLDDDYPSLLFAISCSVGKPETYGGARLGIDLLTKPGFGSSAGVISATRGAAAARYWPQDPSGVESICYEYNNNLIVGQQKVGDALYNAKFYCNQNYAWDFHWEYMNLFGYNLYGDPSMVREGVE